jgi:hypothetical protein
MSEPVLANLFWLSGRVEEVGMTDSKLTMRWMSNPPAPSHRTSWASPGLSGASARAVHTLRRRIFGKAD